MHKLPNEVLPKLRSKLPQSAICVLKKNYIISAALNYLEININLRFATFYVVWSNVKPKL